jgi:integrase
MKALKVKPWKPEAGEQYEAATVGSVVVRIYRRLRTRLKGGTREYFEVSDHTSGRRHIHGFAKLHKARACASRIAEQLASGESTAAGMSNSQAASYGRAVELLLPTGAAIEVACATYAKCFAILGSDRMTEAATFFQRHAAASIAPRTVRQVADELLQVRTQRTTKGTPASPHYIRSLKNQLKRFAKDFACEVGSITTGELQTWLDKLKCAPRTVKGFRTTINTLMSFAEARGYIFKGSNPVDGTESIVANEGAIEIFTPAEVAALLAAAPKAFLPVVAIGAFAGVRTAELQRLTWQDIDLAGGFITVGAAQAKTASRRLVPITPNLAAWLAPYAKQRGTVWKSSATALEEHRAETVKKSGVPWKHNALRHSFCSYRLADIQNAAQVSLEAGNSPQMIFRHYRELVKPEAAKAWFAVGPEQPANVLPMKEAAAV